MNNVLLSIIIPVYNTGKYLKRCLDSILDDNTDGSIELLCVNDGSTDCSGSILEQYRDRYPSTVRVLNQKNAGVSNARNNGIKMASGDYIMFVDSDDFLSRNGLNEILNIIRTSPSDFIITGVCRLSNSGVSTKSRLDNQHYLSSGFVRLHNSLDALSFGSPCAKVFVKNIITQNNIQFNETLQLFEDATFIYQYLPHCHDVRTSSVVFYNYMVNSTSSTFKYRGNVFFHNLNSYRKMAIDCINNFDASASDKASCIEHLNDANSFQVLFAIYSIYRACNRPAGKYKALLDYLTVNETIGGGGTGEAVFPS